MQIKSFSTIKVQSAMSKELNKKSILRLCIRENVLCSSGLRNVADHSRKHKIKQFTIFSNLLKAKLLRASFSPSQASFKLTSLAFKATMNTKSANSICASIASPMNILLVCWLWWFNKKRQWEVSSSALFIVALCYPQWRKGMKTPSIQTESSLSANGTLCSIFYDATTLCCSTKLGFI